MTFEIFNQDNGKSEIRTKADISMWYKRILLMGEYSLFNIWVKGHKHYKAEFGTLLEEDVPLSMVEYIIKNYKD